MTNAIQTLFGRKMHPAVSARLFAVSIRARGLSIRHGVRQTVRVPCLSMAAMVASEVRS